MALLNLPSDVSNFLKGVITKRVKTYDPTKNKIIVAGMVLDGVVSATLSEHKRTEAIVGVDRQYNTTYESFSTQTIEVTLLPETICYEKLEELAWMCHKNKAMFGLSIEENGGVFDNFQASILSFSGITLSLEGEDKTITFNVSPRYAVPSKITTVAQTNNDGVTPYTGNAQTYPLAESGSITRESLPLPFNINQELP